MENVNLFETVCVLLDWNIPVNKIAIILGLSHDKVMDEIVQRTGVIKKEKAIVIMNAFYPLQKPELWKGMFSLLAINNIETIQSESFLLQKDILSKPLKEVYKGENKNEISNLEYCNITLTWQFIDRKPVSMADHYTNVLKKDAVMEVAEWLLLHKKLRYNRPFLQSQKSEMREIAAVI
ncbi:TPA: hypothetical protein DEP21_02695 [Patescibacteria group bacterium]|nr:hypothetical protein [Candidatus Gracilibacteria bacterium]